MPRSTKCFLCGHPTVDAVWMIRYVKGIVEHTIGPVTSSQAVHCVGWLAPLCGVYSARIEQVRKTGSELLFAPRESGN